MEEKINRAIELYDDLITVPEYLDRIGVTDGRKYTGDILTLCPIHDEEEPSFSYSANLGIWTCFGECHTSGRAVKLNYLIQNKSGRVGIIESLRLMRELFPFLPELVFNEDKKEKYRKKTNDANVSKLAAIANKNTINQKTKIKIKPKNQDINDLVLDEFLRGCEDESKEIKVNR